MRPRPSKAHTPLDHKQEELARQSSKVREEMQQLERMIAEAPRVAQEKARHNREELLTRANEGGRRLNASVALHDTRWDDGGQRGRPQKSLRSQRREGRIIFIVLVLALSAAVIWLASHLHF